MRKGFAQLFILLIVTVGIIVGGVVYWQFKSKRAPQPQPTTNSQSTATPSPKTSQISRSSFERPTSVYVQDNKLYVADSGTESSGSFLDFPNIPPKVWIFNTQTGELISSYKYDTKEFFEKQKELFEGRREADKFKYKPPSYDVAVTTNPNTNKTYVASGQGLKRWIDVYNPDGVKVKKIDIGSNYLLTSSNDNVYAVVNGEEDTDNTYIAKINSKTDEVVYTFRFVGVKNIAFGVDSSIFADKDEIFVSTVLHWLEPAKTKLIVFDLNKDEFTYQYELKGKFHSLFPWENTIFLAGPSGVIQIDKKTGNII